MRATARLCVTVTASAALFVALDASGSAGVAEPPTCRGVAPTITGQGRTIKGTSGNDVIAASGHQDLILARKGDDLVCGRGNDDLIAGQGGEDALFGQGGHDILLGNAGDDRLRGGSGDDRLNGGEGVDRCGGGNGQVAFSPRTCEQHPSSRLRGLRPLYYLGLNFGLYPLTAFGVRISDNPTTAFLYGHPHGTWPVEIQVWSACRRWPGAYPERLEVFPFRGAAAAWNRFGGALEIYTQRVAIVIFADDDRLALDAGRNVRTVVGDREGHLPPPAEGVIDGSLPCQ
jgi:hypothetical protein